MDRERLKEVHQTDLTESKVNEDFVDWLKTKGPTWLLVFLVAICAYLGIVRFRQHKADYRSDAWAALTAASLPGSFEDVAREYGDVGEIANVARLMAADTLLESVQNGLVLGATPPTPPGPGQPPVPVPPEDLLSAEQREHHLQRAEGLYQEVIDSDDGTNATTLYVVSAMNGMAAIAEARADAEQAREWYDMAAQRAETRYPGLANQARLREESVGLNSTPVTFPSRSELTQRAGNVSKILPVEVDEALRQYLLPAEEDEAGTTG